eukprot:2703293-Amphidinium_carterae.1
MHRVVQAPQVLQVLRVVQELVVSVQGSSEVSHCVRMLSKVIARVKVMVMVMVKLVDVDRARLCRPVGGVFAWDTVDNVKEHHAVAKVRPTMHAVSSQRHGDSSHPPTSERSQ